MQARKTLERLFLNKDWPECTEERIKEVVDKFYSQFGNSYAEMLGESLGRYLSVQPNRLKELQIAIKDYSLLLLTSGFAGPRVKERIKPSYVVYAKANVVLSYLEHVLRTKKYADIDYKEELNNLITEKLNYIFG